MAKEKVRLEYVLRKVSPAILWSSISTPMGLTGWFADNVTENSGIFTLHWQKVSEEAELLQSSPMSYVRFRWLTSGDESYFEMRMGENKLTGDMSLVITEFAEESEKQELVDLWDNQIMMLKRKIGA